jgi:aryl-alcohol dehydrogenase-like predicted oxidoreductase
MESVHASLKRLNTDHIDLYQMHRFDHETPVEESLRAFDDLIRQGKVHYIGFSEWSAPQISQALEIQKARGFDRFVSSQPQYSMLWRVIEEEVVPASEREGLSQIVWSPMAQGVLTGKYLPGQPPPEGSRATDELSGKNFISRWLTDTTLTKVQELKPIAQEAGITMAQMAIAWVLQNKNVASAIVGATRPEQLDDNVKAANIVLEPAIMAKINTVLDGIVVSNPRKTESPKTRF